MHSAMLQSFVGLYRCASLSLVFLFSVSLTGCGGDDVPATGESTAGTGAQNEAQDQMAEPAAGANPMAGGGGHGAEQMPGATGQMPGATGQMPGTTGQMAGAGGHDAEQMADPGMSTNPAMMTANPGSSSYPGGDPAAAGGISMNGQAGGQGKASRPADVSQWTTEQLLAAVDEKDAKVLRAIEAKAARSQGDPEFAQLMTQVLQTSSGGHVDVGTNPAAGGFGFPGLQGLFGSGAPDTGSSNSQPGRPPTGVPSRLNGKPGVPPGGAFYRPEPDSLRSTPAVGIDSLDVMIGQSMLCYMPQATQGTRDAAERLKSSAGATPAGSSAQTTGNYPGAAGSTAQPTGSYPGMNAGAASGYPGGADDMYAGDGTGNGNRPSGSLQEYDLVRAVVRALVFNNTAPAWKTLQDIVAGTVSTPLPLPANLEIVLTEVFSADSLNVPVAQQILTSATQEVISNPAENQPTMRLLAALSQHPTDHFLMLANKAAPPPPGGPGRNDAGSSGQMIPGRPPGSGAGQMPPGSPGGAGSSEGAATPGGVAYPGADMAATDGEYGGEGDPQGFGGANRPPPPGMQLPPVRVSKAGMVPVASILWSRDAVTAVTSQLEAAADPNAVMDVLAFASTIPSNAVRHATLGLFERAHEQGAMGLLASGLFRDVARDPGLLAVLKALPRDRQKKPATPDLNAPAPPMDPKESWVAATQDVVLSLRHRLRGVADDPTLKYDGLQRLRLHRGAIPDRSIKISAPGSAASALGDSAPAATTIYYSSCRVSPQRESEMKVVVDHYEKRSKGIRREDRSKGLLWFDGVQENSDGTRETMDVVIEQMGFRPQGNDGFGEQYGGSSGAASGGFGGSGGPGAGQGGAGGPQFTIEVIVVVTSDPKTASTEPAVTAAAGAE